MKQTQSCSQTNRDDNSRVHRPSLKRRSVQHRCNMLVTLFNRLSVRATSRSAIFSLMRRLLRRAGARRLVCIREVNNFFRYPIIVNITASCRAHLNRRRSFRHAVLLSHLLEELLTQEQEKNDDACEEHVEKARLWIERRLFFEMFTVSLKTEL